jgi:hypothetical protein
MKLQHIRIKLQEAAQFTLLHHRHSKPLKRHKFSIGAKDEYGILLGVVTVDTCSSHEWSKRRDHIEIRRLVTKDISGLPIETNIKNVASFLLGKAITACFALGFKYIVTYTQPGETGSSLKALGFRIEKIKVQNYTNKTYKGLVTWVLCEDYQKNPDFDYTNDRLKDIKDYIKDYSNAKLI